MAPLRATYRLQFHKGFTFRDALELVPYLDELGVSHIYASPITEARPGSTHGYDIVNHNRLNPEIGSEEDFQALVAALRERGMGLILDIVPNHMGVGGKDNAWWLDVLEWGEASPYARYFDINWDAARADLKGRVLLPVLGDQYGVIVERGEITLRFDKQEGSFSFWYYDHRFPVSPFSYARILAAGGMSSPLLADDFTALKRAHRDAARTVATNIKRRLAAAAEDRTIAASIETAVDAWSGTPGRAASFRPLHRLLDQQFYRLAYWRVAADEINYRRFFNINDLAGLRIELPESVRGNPSAGVRDGRARRDRRVAHRPYRRAVRSRRLRRGVARTVSAAVLSRRREILARYETLPDWPIDGSTGYDFANQVLGLFVDPDAERATTRLYQRLTGRTRISTRRCTPPSSASCGSTSRAR